MASDGPWSEQQTRVDDQFRDTALDWKSLYGRDGLRPQLFRDRQAIVLDWVDGLGLAHGARVLEVGSGAGLLAVALARRGLRVHAVDRLADMAELTRRHATESGVAAATTIGLGDAYDLPFRDGVFDLVVSLGVFTWLERGDRALREMGRVTRPGGYVVFTAPNRTALSNVLDPVRNPVLGPLRDWMRAALERLGTRRPTARQQYYSRRSLETAVADAALTLIRTRTHGFIFTCFYRLVLPDSLATVAHRQLQRLTDSGAPGLRSLGRTHFVMARKAP